MGDFQIIQDTNATPHPHVCRFEVKRRLAGTFFSTGSLIGNSHILTAAHNFKNRGFFVGDVKSAYATLGKHGSGEFHKCGQIYNKRRCFIPQGYSSNKWNKDYCLIALRNPLSFASSFRLPVDGDKPLTVGDTVFAAGYQNPDTLMKGGSGKVLTVEGDVITYDIDTSRGNSGGPIWTTNDAGEHILQAVHNSGFGTTGRGVLTAGNLSAQIAVWGYTS